MATNSIEIETRISLLLAVGRYLRAVDRFATASKEMTNACSELREQLSQSSRFVTRIDFQSFLVTSDDEGDFGVEQIDSAQALARTYRPNN